MPPQRSGIVFSETLLLQFRHEGRHLGCGRPEAVVIVEEEHESSARCSQSPVAGDGRAHGFQDDRTQSIIWQAIQPLSRCIRGCIVHYDHLAGRVRSCEHGIGGLIGEGEPIPGWDDHRDTW
jgi:hypothetical protein